MRKKQHCEILANDPHLQPMLIDIGSIYAAVWDDHMTRFHSRGGRQRSRWDTAVKPAARGESGSRNPANG